MKPRSEPGCYVNGPRKRSLGSSAKPTSIVGPSATRRRRPAAAARADADTSRAEARDLLTHARAEVKALAARRDDITAQLGNLSGVIEALAVPGPPRVTGEGAAPIPENAEPNLSLTANATTGTR